MSRACPNGDGPFADGADRGPASGAFGAGREPIVWLAAAPNEPVALMRLDALRHADIPSFANALGPGFGDLGADATLERAVQVTAPILDRARRVVAGPPPTRPRRRAIAANRPFTGIKG